MAQTAVAALSLTNEEDQKQKKELIYVGSLWLRRDLHSLLPSPKQV